MLQAGPNEFGLTLKCNSVICRHHGADKNIDFLSIFTKFSKSTHSFTKSAIGMIGDETGHQLKMCIAVNKIYQNKWILIHVEHIIAASSLKTQCIPKSLFRKSHDTGHPINSGTFSGHRHVCSVEDLKSGPLHHP